MRLFVTSLLYLFVSLTIFSLSSCASYFSSDNYDTYSVGGVSRVYSGVVVTARTVNINDGDVNNVSGTTAGGLTGAVIGAAASDNSAIGIIGGGIMGGIMGNAISSSLNEKGTEYVIKLESGKMISVVQVNENPFQPGTHVLVELNNTFGSRARVILDTSYE